MNKEKWYFNLLNINKKLALLNIINYIKKLRNEGKIIYPKQKDIFNAFNFTTLSKIKVVIIGQDPYCNPNQAHGFSFSVPKKTLIPPSLNNIFKELKRDISNFKKPNHGNLLKWSNQGVFLLNSILTVEKGKPGSHANIGWEVFTDEIIKIINKNKSNVIFLLWGNFAKKKTKLINMKKNFVLHSSHPSPLSAKNGFFGCCHFSKTNKILIKNKIYPIDWNI